MRHTNGPLAQVKANAVRIRPLRFHTWRRILQLKKTKVSLPIILDYIDVINTQYRNENKGRRYGIPAGRVANITLPIPWYRPRKARGFALGAVTDLGMKSWL